MRQTTILSAFTNYNYHYKSVVNYIHYDSGCHHLHVQAIIHE